MLFDPEHAHVWIEPTRTTCCYVDWDDDRVGDLVTTCEPVGLSVKNEYKGAAYPTDINVKVEDGEWINFEVKGKGCASYDLGDGTTLHTADQVGSPPGTCGAQWKTGP